MDYVHGETLASLMARSAEEGILVPIAVAVAAVRDLLRGLHAAHEATTENGTPLGIVHRDVSPQNVIVGADGSARLFDFGVAKAVGRLQTTREGAAKGKLGYMAPEQLKNGPIDRRADVYAASVVLWELLTGRRLFDGDSEAQVLASVLVGHIEPPSHFRDAVSPSLDAVVMRGLSRRRDDRFLTAAEMVEALDRAAEPADSEAVAHLVRSLAADSLARRAAIVKQAEACEAPAPLADVPESPVVDPTGSGRDHRSRRVWLAVWLAASIVGAAAVVALVVARVARTPASPPLPDPVTPTVVMPASVSLPVVKGPPQTNPSGLPSTAAWTPTPLKKPVPAATRAPTTARPCASVIIDQAGIHRYNRDCR
jgi:serine/threonine-protein kinase